MALVLVQGDALAAGAQAWTLQDSAGQVRLVKSGISPIALTTGDVFAGGDWIETGPDGRAVLMRGDERIVVAPNSRIGLPREDTGPFATRILHTLGTILLTVEKKASQHFEVQTPYLTAVVKGTTFTVGIQGQRAVVHVVEGLVEVRDLASGQRGMVRPGQTASVLSGGRPGVSVEGGNRGADVPASVEPHAAPYAAPGDGAVVIREALGPSELDLVTATGGLVRDSSPAGGALDTRTAAESAASGTSGLVGSGTRAAVTSTSTTTLTSATATTTTALTTTTQTTTTALTSLSQPTTSPLTTLTQPTTTTLTAAIEPIASPVISAVQPVVSPVTSAIQPVVDPVTGLLK